MEDHVGQAAVGLRVAGDGQDRGLSAEAVRLRQWVAQLSQAGLQGAQAGWEVVGGHRGGHGGVGGGRQGLALGVGLAARRGRVCPFPRPLHP